MTLINDMHLAVERMAQSLWEGAPHEADLALLREPVDLRVALADFEERIRVGFDDEWGLPWQLQTETLLHMNWNAAGPGLGSTWILNVIVLPSGRRLYVEQSDSITRARDCVLSVSEPTATARTDRRLLQLLFRDNGAAFGTGLFGSPPNSVKTCVKSFPFLVDLFVSGFDAAGEDCWEALLEGWDVWNEEYENPRDPIELPGTLLAEADAVIRSRYGAPKGMTEGYRQQAQVEALAREKSLRDEIEELLNEPLRRRSASDPQAKAQIVARYLNYALGNAGLG